ncbi:hypothetical protein GCM10009680_10130 [Streptomyces yatensis]|uniref:Uncharacterized protein n=1 Tax=Streptomyces yatensis TaxID=155177 RepID=A0ABN2GJP7_9ACTN
MTFREAERGEKGETGREAPRSRKAARWHGAMARQARKWQARALRSAESEIGRVRDRQSPRSEEGGRWDGPLPGQPEQEADHTRPKSMWSRVTRGSSVLTRNIQPRTGPFRQPLST